MQLGDPCSAPWMPFQPRGLSIGKGYTPIWAYPSFNVPSDMKPGTGPVAGCDGSSFNMTQPGTMRDEGFSARLSRVDWHVGVPVG